MKKEGKLPRGLRKRGGSYVAFLTHPDGHSERRTIGCVSLQTAILQRGKWQLELLEGKYIKRAVRAGAATFEEIADAWLVKQRENPKSLESTESRVKLLKEWWGPRLARDLTKEEIAAKLTEAATDKKWADATFNNYRLCLSGTYRLAIENKKVDQNPASKVKLRRLNNERCRFLTREKEYPALRQIVAEHYPERLPDFDLALHTGMRHSEMYGRHEKRIKTPGLTWQDVHLAQHFVTIPESKNGKKRHVILNNDAEAALSVLQERHKASNRAMVNTDGSDYLGISTKWFDKAVKRAGIIDFSWHCLRHTFASWLVMDGVNMRTVQVLMGHSSIKMTERYAHLAPDHMTSAVNRLSRRTVAAEPTTDTSFPPAPTSTDTESDTGIYDVLPTLVQ